MSKPKKDSWNADFPRVSNEGPSAQPEYCTRPPEIADMVMILLQMATIRDGDTV